MLHLIDAYALIFRAYYAFIRTPRINSKGVNTSAIFGFLNTFEELMRREQMTHAAIVFDPAGPTFRHKEFESYKANRDATPEDIRIAVPVIKELMTAYGIKIVEVPGYEADDVIGTLATRAAAQGIDTYMITPDKDYEQLVADHIYIIKPRKGKEDITTFGTRDVLDKWGIESTKQVIDLLGLMGDTADNIPGCPGVGEKTAVDLIHRFGSIENLLANTDQLKGAQRRNVETNIQQIKDSKYLATICTDVPINFSLDDYIIRPQDTVALITLLDNLEFRSHKIKLEVTTTYTDAPIQASLFDQPPSTASTSTTTATAVPPPAPAVLTTIDTYSHSFTHLDTAEAIDHAIAALLQAPIVAMSLITSTQESMTCRPLTIALAANATDAYIITLPQTDTGIATNLRHFLPLFTSTDTVITTADIKHCHVVLRRYDIHITAPVFDIEIAHYLLQPEMKHDAVSLAQSMLNYECINLTSTAPKGRKQADLTIVPQPILADLAAERAIVIHRLTIPLSQRIDDHDLRHLFYDIELPLSAVLARMEYNGVLVDDFALSQISEQLTARMASIERDIRSIVGSDINISSPKQVGELLFDTLALDDRARKTKKGQYSTDEETLESIRHKHPVVGKILEYRGLKKLLSTYVDALPRLINTHTGRVHTSFNQTVTATGRLSSSNPNLQNIPIRTDNGREIRRAFIASEGCTLLSADYSQVELRLMAHLSHDNHMIDAFRLDQDIHAATAAKIYHVGLDAVTSDMRRKAKTANFGIIYGISAFGLAQRLDIPRSEAKSLIDNYFESFPSVRQYIDEAIDEARRNGYVETLMHRRRYLPDISSHNAVVRSYAERNAVNAPIQGSAADIIKVAMINIDRRLREEGLKTKMILQVHDELIFDVPTDELATVTDIVRHEMEHAYRLTVPLRIDIGTGTSWLDAH